MVLHGVQRASPHVIGRVADGVGLGGPAEGHLRRGDGRLGRVLVVAVDVVGGEEDGDDEGEEHGRGDDGLADIVTHGLWSRAQSRDKAMKKQLYQLFKICPICIPF